MNLVESKIHSLLTAVEVELLYKNNTISQWKGMNVMWGIFTPQIDENTSHLEDKYIEGLKLCLVTIRNKCGNPKGLVEFCLSKKARHLTDMLLTFVKKGDAKSFNKYVNYGCLSCYERFLK